MNIVITGPKGAGKSAIGGLLASQLGLDAVETDSVIEDLSASGGAERKTCREIYREMGAEAFRALEREAVRQVAAQSWRVIITGGGTMMDPDSRRALRQDAIVIFVTANRDTLWQRTTSKGLPPWLEGEDGRARFERETDLREETLRPFADIVLDASDGTPEERADSAAEAVGAEISLRGQSANTYGEIVRMTTFGESHGTGVGAVLDGVQPGLDFPLDYIQEQLDRRRPGQSKVTTQRKETDKLHVLSGVFEGKTTGHPIAMLIYNEDQDPSRYDYLRELFRPGHADFTFHKKYGIRDHRGGGRSSARETAARVACGAFARKILEERGVSIVAHTLEIGGIRAKRFDAGVIESNLVRCADPEAAQEMEDKILAVKREGDSLGGIVQLEVTGVPPGLGDPVMNKLDARLTASLMTIPATKGVEIGLGFELARMRGSQSNDAMHDGRFLSNNAGGIIGGISNGEPIVARLAIKPTSSIAHTQQTIDVHGANRDIQVLGRHDPCVVPRAVPIVENLAALVLLDAWEVQARLRPGWPASPI